MNAAEAHRRTRANADSTVRATVYYWQQIESRIDAAAKQHFYRIQFHLPAFAFNHPAYDRDRVMRKLRRMLRRRSYTLRRSRSAPDDPYTLVIKWRRQLNRKH